MTTLIRILIVPALAAAASTAQAQSAPSRWSVDFGIGFDNSISGNINSGAIGSLNNQTVVIIKNPYEEVYGTGLHLRVGGGYMLNDEVTEVRGTFTFQSLDADLTPMGDYGASPLYAQYSDYQSLSLDLGLRRYFNPQQAIRPYAEGTLGIGFIDSVNVMLAAPQAGLVLDSTDFYDQTAAFTLGANFGVVWNVSERIGAFGQMGVRFVTGMSEVDQLVGTGLDAINDDSARWTIPFSVGIRVGF